MRTGPDGKRPATCCCDHLKCEKIGYSHEGNGQAKNASGFFDSTVRIDQIGLADLLFRVTFLLLNFKLPFIQDRD